MLFPGKVVNIAAGSLHSLALLEGGEVYAWGMNGNGQLGNGTYKDRNVPKLIKTLPGKVVGIAAGYYHTLAFLENGKVFGWGRNAEGQLGNGTTIDNTCPQIIESITGKVVGIAAGAYHSLALLEGGEVYAWGMNGDGQLGIGATTWSNLPS